VPKIIEKGQIASAAGDIHWLLATAVADLVDETVAANVLSPAESEYWQKQKTSKRRHDWLLGRWAAKHLLQEQLHKSTGRIIRLDEIEIARHDDGWPQLRLPAEVGVSADFTLSISHSHDAAFCAISARSHSLLGVDIEYVETRSAGFVADYFTRTEQAFLAAAPSGLEGVLPNAIWSGKEAALKAIRRGLAEDTRIVTCLPHPPIRDEINWLLMRVDWEQAGSKPILTGWWRQSGDFVMTVAAGLAIA
jgi:4'-phosphopantetheinyl transferase